MRKQLLFWLIMLLPMALWAQSGEIRGTVTDADNKEAIPFATIAVVGTTKGTTTDFDGNYSLKLTPGRYDLKVTYVGYQEAIVTGIVLSADKIIFQDFAINSSSTELGPVVVTAYKVPLIDKDNTASGGAVTREDIKNMPTRNVESIASKTAGTFQADEGAAINVKGGRSEGTEFYIDGIRVRGGTALPANAIEQLNVITGGIPAKYGDATGGIISITTRSASQKFGGGMEFITSMPFRPYYNHLTATLAGPILKVGGTENKRTLLDFFIAGEIIRDKDDMLAATDIYRVKQSVLDSLKQYPLLPSSTGVGFVKSIDYVTLNDMESSEVRENVELQEINFSTKFNFIPIRNFNFTFGGSFNLVDGGLQERNRTYRDFVRRYEPFNWEHNPQTQDFTYRFFGRFSQEFNTSQAAEGEEKKEGLFSNIFYSIQADYTKDKVTWFDPIHEDRFFDYGYVGSFNTTRTPIYQQTTVNAVDEITGAPITLTGRGFLGYGDNGVAYTPGTLNPEAANQTSYYYQLAGDDQANFYNTLNQISLNNGLINGSRPPSLESVYSMYYLPGAVWDDYLKSAEDQYRLSFNSSVDVKKPGVSENKKHSIEFGFEYEQRVEREYRMAPAQLWDRMRALVSRPGLKDIALDLDNPILVINGQRIPLSDYNPELHGIWSAYDTITYNYVRTAQGSKIDQEIRSRFGYGDLDFVNTDALDPSKLSLDMFSPDDLYGTGTNNVFTSLYGYDYLGNKLSKDPGFEDFFKRDENGYLSGKIGAFRPIYMAGYIQDKFAFKDLIFNVGLRVDRYDANQKVLKDIYSLYGVRTAGEVGSINGNNVQHPSTVGGDYVVYVDNPVNPTKIVGYRSGDNWYNANGTFINDVRILEQSGQLFPYLSNPLDNDPKNDIKDENFDINTTFKDYVPQINLMPRIAFSFPISDVALFYAHYNVLTQRPQGNNFLSPLDYYFWQEKAIDTRYDNPNLKPEKTIDYQLGFKQKIGERSALTIAAFYREMRDMLNVVQVQGYPVNYTTYRNIDFGNVKGMEFTYDLRRSGPVKLVATYTLQFADGTGSSSTSGANLANNGLPNLRAIFPMSYDARHTFNITFDYRYGEGKDYTGPRIGKFDLLANTGLNVVTLFRSGTPYSQQKTATPEGQFGIAGRTTLEGNPYGSRMSGNFRIDMKLDRDIKIADKKGSRDARYMNVYVWIQNLLDTKNVLSVYDFTGRGDDDGYIDSVQGQNVAATATYTQSFIDLYRLRVDNPYNFTLPRRARVGVSFSF